MSALIHLVSAAVMMTWVFASLVLLNARADGVEPMTWVRTCWAELRPFFLPANAAFVVSGFLLNAWILISAAFVVPLSLLLWRLLKDLDDDDDRWKRRKAKLAGKVARKGARLVVVPVSAGSR